jgi:lipopolysaccharide transport system ATP-binding protein
MHSAIRVDNLSKHYQLGQRGGPAYRTLRESLMGAAADVWSALKRVGSPLRSRWRAEQKANPREFWALKDVSFEVQPGEVVGIIGRNGAGKSTLLKILSRITEPTSGRAEVRGRMASLLEVGTGFHSELTGRENIYLNGSILGMSRREIGRKFDEIVAFSEIDQFLDTPVKRYSSGMYVRLAFAVAAHLEPEILVIDEVLAVGDVSFQQKCMGKMGTISRNGRTVLFVSHNMPAIQALCQRAILLAGGSLREEGPANHVISHYLSDASRETTGVFDLREHPARAPRSAPIIRELAMRRKTGEAGATFFPDEPVDVEILVETPNTIREPRIAIAIEDSFGRRITTCANYFTQTTFADLTGCARYVCSLDQLRLGCGRYLISVSVGAKFFGLIDSIDNAAWFEVGWRNNFKNGEQFASYYGPVLTESTWKRIA